MRRFFFEDSDKLKQELHMVAMFLQNETKVGFFLHDLIEVLTKRLVPIDLLHIPDLILKLYVFPLIV